MARKTTKKDTSTTTGKETREAIENISKDPEKMEEITERIETEMKPALTFKEFLAANKNNPELDALARQAEIQFEQAMDDMVDESYAAHFQKDIDLEEAAEEMATTTPAPTEMPHDIRPKYQNKITFGKASDLLPTTDQLIYFIKLYASYKFTFKAPKEMTKATMYKLINACKDKVLKDNLPRRDYPHTFEQECCRVARVLLEKYPTLATPPHALDKGINLKMVTEGSGAWDNNYKTRIVK